MKALVYLLQVSACTGIFYLFYRLFLSRLTFFNINRWYLLATVLLSFIIPVLTIPVHPQQQNFVVIKQAVDINTMQNVPVNMDKQVVSAAAKSADWLQVIKLLYVLIVAGLLIHLLVTLMVFFNKLKGKLIAKVDQVSILRGENKLHNGSFFNYIFLNDHELSADVIQQIIAHEMLHVKFYHSADRLLIRLAQIILWFNPFIYLYAKAVEENHEFEVDCAMAISTDKKQYANLLLQLSVAGQGMLYHSFSKIPLKKRIVMLFNQPSAKMKKAIYVLILPVLLISCLAFAKLKSDLNSVKKGNNRKNLSQKLTGGNRLRLIKQNQNLYGKNSINNYEKNLDTTKYRPKFKRTTAQIEAQKKAEVYRQTADFKHKEKLAKQIWGKVVTVKIKAKVDVEKADILDSGDHKMAGFTVSYNGNDYFLRTKYGQEKQLNDLLKVGDEITMKVFGCTSGPDSPIIIGPAFVYKNNVKIFQLAEAAEIPDYAFLYEVNKVRFADGQITHIQKYPNGKWKSAVLEIVNGYKFNLNFKPTAPDFSGIVESDHVRFRFVHEEKTGAKTYRVNDWVSITTNIKDYGIKNPDFFYKFYEPRVVQNQKAQRNFEVTGLSYQAPEKMLAELKKDQPNSYISPGKNINVNILKAEQARVYKYLAAQFPDVEQKDIVFNVDTTLQKGFCTIKTVVKPADLTEF